ncbi:MAG: hypothetical protein NTW96_26690 [Planctomycetia bacterium]|nr:hypothetical protein [Planctomycetia bacterium]
MTFNHHQIVANDPDDPALLEWAAENDATVKQLGRRNLSENQKDYLRGKRYKSEEKGVGKRGPEQSGQNVHLKTAEKLAEEYDVDERTIRRDADFAEAVDNEAERTGNFRVGKTSTPKQPNGSPKRDCGFSSQSACDCVGDF